MGVHAHTHTAHAHTRKQYLPSPSDCQQLIRTCSKDYVNFGIHNLHVHNVRMFLFYLSETFIENFRISSLASFKPAWSWMPWCRLKCWDSREFRNRKPHKWHINELCWGDPSEKENLINPIPDGLCWDSDMAGGGGA